MVNVIPRENILPFMKYKGFSYPTQLLKIGGSGIKNYLIERNKSKYLRDDIFFIRYLLQIKQNVYSLGTFRAPVATHIKKYRKKSHFDRIPFLY